MNLAQFRSRVGGIIGLDTSNAGTERDLHDSWLSEACEQFLMETRIYVKAGQANFTTDQWEYDVDDDILDWIDMWIETSTTGITSQPQRTTASEIVRMRNVQGQVAGGTPIYIATRGWNSILIYPTPNSSDVLHFMYVPKPGTQFSSSSATSDSPSATAYGGIPSQFHPVLLDYVLWKAADYDDDTSSQIGMAYNASWEKGVAMAKKNMNTRLGSDLPPIRWGRRKNWPIVAAPGVDLG